MLAKGKAPQIAKALLLLAFGVMPKTLAAQQFDTSLLLVPNSAEVVYDIQNSETSSKQQRGYVEGWQYVLYPDGSAIIRSNENSDRAKIAVNCELTISCTIDQDDTQSITVAATGAPRPYLPSDITGQKLARFVAESVLAGPGQAIAPVAPAIAEAESTEPVEKIAETSDTKEPAAAAPQSAVIKTPPAKIAQKAVPPRRATRSKAAKPRTFSVQNQKPTAKPTPVQPIVTKQKKPRLKFGEKYNLACTVSATGSLTYVDTSNDETRSGKPRVNFGCFVKLSERLSGRVALVRYINPNLQEAWDPDYTYDFSYKVSDKLKLRYSNYSARFQGEGESFAKSLTTGIVRASYTLPEIKLPYDKKLRCSASIRLPDPRRSSANLYCSAALTKKLFVAATLQTYFPGRQKSYQPDFTYTATYKISNLWNLTYSNYGNNRFPWNKSTSPGRGLLGGSITISYKIKF